jgi:adenylate cyclase
VVRRLAAILVADVVGYSRLMEADEAGTLSALKQRRKNVLSPIVELHGGRIVKFMGDGVLVEFASPVDAVNAARALQDGFAQANASSPAAPRIELRIGINLGDIVSEGADIFGDGVNVAARLEPLAEPGGICISGKVRDELAGKIDVAAEDLGELQLKNIARPVRAFRLVTGETARQRSAGPVTAAAPGDKPSIAVLPFANMSADPEQEYFSDGITEDIITDLSRIAGLMVVARNSSFAYKNKNSDIRVVARELGVRSVLEGSIRRAGNRVRITAQLIDAASGGHLWAERYDRELTDIFEVQDEVTRCIVDALEVALRPAEETLLRENRASNMEAHDCFLRGRELLLGASKNREVFDRIVALLRRAIELDPGFAPPYAGLAMAHCLDYQNRWTDGSDALDLSVHFARQATEKGPNDPYGHYAAAVVDTWTRDLAKAKAEAERAIALNPSYALAYGTLGLVEVYLGRPLEAVPIIERAIRLDPVFTQQYMHFLGTAYLMADRYETAAATFRERIRLSPKTDLSRAFLACALGHLGEVDEARRIWRELMEINPRYSLAGHLARLPLQNPADADRIRNGLAKAGLLE